MTASTKPAAWSSQCDVSKPLPQVDDCIAKYLWMKELLERVAKVSPLLAATCAVSSICQVSFSISQTCHMVVLQAKREGQPLPTSMEDMEQSLGDWRQFRSSTAAAARSSDTAVSPRPRQCL